MVELFHHTAEQDGRGHCVVASLLMSNLTITSTRAERTIKKKKKEKKPFKWRGSLPYLCAAEQTLDTEEDEKAKPRFYF